MIKRHANCSSVKKRRGNKDADKNTLDVEIETKALFGYKGVGEMVLDFSIINEEPESNVPLTGITQEPWPQDVKLFQPYEVEQILLPDNANCLAVQAFLKMCHLEYQVVPKPNAEAMSPTLKVPFIKAGRFVIAELEGIVQFVNGKGITLTERLDNDQKADMRAFMTLMHSVIEVAELYICWVDKETYQEVTSVRNGSVYPWPLNHIQNRAKRNQVIKKLKALEWYNKTIEDVFLEVENCCEALSTRLDGKPYFFEEGPCEIDALLYGHLYAILTTFLPACHNRLANLVRSFGTLVEYCQRLDEVVMNRSTDFFDDAYSYIENDKSHRVGCFSFWSPFHNSDYTVTQK